MEHFVVQIGILMAITAVLAMILRAFKISSILAYIAVGVIVAQMGLKMSEDTVHAISETGIILLLFMAGLEVDLKSFAKRWKLVAIVGMGQIVLNLVLGILVGLFVVDIENVTTLVYFGLCLTLSSTIVVLGLLKTRREMESLHGQLILGLMVLQDITAVLALAVLKSISSGEALAPALGMLFVKLVGLAVAMYLVSRFLLKPLFRRYAGSSEMLFIGAMGWALGIAALGEGIHFSPEIAAFMAGVALSILPYKLEIEDKVEPIKSFGVVLFFIALGYSLDLGPETVELIVPILVVVLLAVIGTVPLMLFLGYVARLKSRPAFMLGSIINQISEFSLILATLCLQAGVFEKSHFMIIALSCVVSIVLSGFGHQFLRPIFDMLAGRLGILDERARKDLEDHSGRENHIVIFGHNEMSDAICQHMADTGHEVLVIDLDPDVHSALTESSASHVIPFYADMYDPDTWEEAGVRNAAMVISCHIGDQEAELGLLRWMGQHKIATPFVAATDSSAEALELYEGGATLVIQADEIVGHHLKDLFGTTENWDFTGAGQAHQKRLAKLRDDRPEHFQFL